MAGRFTIRVLTEFAAAHLLRGYPGPCSRLHGHNWKVEVEVETSALDDLGMGLDFRVVKEAARALTADLDHRHLNEIEPFNRINPTAENIAAFLFKGLAKMLNDDRVRISAVTLWETDRASVRYTEDIAP